MSGYLNIVLVPKDGTNDDTNPKESNMLQLMSFPKDSKMYSHLAIMAPYIEKSELKLHKITSGDMHGIISKLQSEISTHEGNLELLIEISKCNVEYYKELISVENTIKELKKDTVKLEMLLYIVTEIENNFNDFQGMYIGKV